jgi:AsmA-like protein
MNKRKWLRAVLIGGVLVFVASLGFSRALRAAASRRYLIAHLAASFGRPVEVSWFDFSLLDGAKIEAHFVSVSDDPHFGNEYFLRADALSAGLRWTALLAGRFEFGSVSLSRPSLNLARDAEGHWNIERWLPPALPPGSRPGFVGPLAPARDARAARPYRIDVDNGRINFKQGDNKSPFALDGVSGRVEQNGEGRWQLDLEARPMRAGVELQDIGTLRLRGSIAGTTARLQPAELDLTWRAASLADTLRFVRQDDYGMRGQLAVDLNARIAPQQSSVRTGADSRGAQWSISAVARLTGVHGWRLPERGTDPAANLAVDIDWRLGDPHAEIRNLIVETPGSRIHGSGDLDWAHGLRPQMRLESAALALGDVLAWYRALRPDVSDDLRADCNLSLDMKLAGWPIQIQHGAIATAGGTLTGKSLSAPLRIGAFSASVSHGGIDFSPAVLSFASVGNPTPATVLGSEVPTSNELRNSFVLRGSLFPRADGVFRWPPDWNFSIEGATSRVQDWLALSGSLAQPMNSSWTAAGGLAVKMRGSHLAVSSASPWLGTVDFLGLMLSPAYVNQPLHLAKAHVEFAPLQRTVTLSAAEAFGAIWRGSITRKYSDKEWAFDLSADRLDAAELDRWLGPRARPGFFARLAGPASDATAAPLADSVATRLAARGRLRAGVIEVPPMRIEEFDGDAELAGRTVRIRKAQANFFGGKISGSFDAQLVRDPSYEFQGHFDRVDLAQLGQAVPFLNDRISGSASSTLTLSAHGIGRQDLIGSMQGQGTLSGRNVELPGSNLSKVFAGDDPEAASDIFASVQGTYRIQANEIDLTNFVMDHARGRLEADGRIDFSHALNIRVVPSIFQAATAPAAASPPTYLLSGTIENPRLALPSSVPKPAVRSNPR